MTDPDVDAVIDFYQHLTPASLARFRELYSADCWFKDPFNEVRGAVAMQGIFAHMFRQVEKPHFVVSERVVDAGGAVLVWEFRFCLRQWRRDQVQVIRGVSHLKFDAAGRINYHRDYWDSAEELYAKLPCLGALMRALRKAFGACDVPSPPP